MEVTNRLIPYVERSGIARPRETAGAPVAAGGMLECVTCGKCGTTEGVARLTYIDEKRHRELEILRCEACLEAGLLQSKPDQAAEIMDFARRFLYHPS